LEEISQFGRIEMTIIHIFSRGTIGLPEKIEEMPLKILLY
jgi:hypothetical protein